MCNVTHVIGHAHPSDSKIVFPQMKSFHLHPESCSWGDLEIPSQSWNQRPCPSWSTYTTICERSFVYLTNERREWLPQWKVDSDVILLFFHWSVMNLNICCILLRDPNMVDLLLILTDTQYACISSTWEIGIRFYMYTHDIQKGGKQPWDTVVCYCVWIWGCYHVQNKLQLETNQG